MEKKYNHVLMALDIANKLIHDVLILRSITLQGDINKLEVLLCVIKTGEVICCSTLEGYDYLTQINMLPTIETMEFDVGEEFPIDWEEYKERVKGYDKLYGRLGCYKFEEEELYESFLRVMHKYGNNSRVEGLLLN